MSKVKIFLEEDETLEQAEADLFKAIGYHVNGDAHESEDFADPAMRDTAQRMEEAHRNTYARMLEEIFEALDKDHSKHGY